MSINAILAMDDNMGIGFDNDLPWPKNKKDLNWFRKCTNGHVVVMGRKTWESIGSRKLPNRINVVVSSQDLDGPDMVMSGDIPAILEQLEIRFPDLHIFVIGGSNIFRQSMPFCDKLYLTRIKGVYRCDTFMYNQDFEDFNETEYVEVDENLKFEIRVKS